MRRYVELPARGRLIVATDLQGNVADFRRVEGLFEEALGKGDATLVITGDLVHGPEIPETQWPDYLGSFFRADSTAVVDAAEALAERHPGKVHYLLGNHEHAHVGGPVVSKFFANEAERLERLMGRARSARVRSWFESWPLVAVAPTAQLLMLHAAPNASIRSPEELNHIALGAGSEKRGMIEGVLADILWARTTSTARAMSFLRAFDPNLRVAVYGHDVARQGYSIDREPLLCISSSFGCFDGDKLYLDWDLASPASSAQQVAAEGLRPLYPDVRPVRRKSFSWEKTSSAPASSSDPKSPA